MKQIIYVSVIGLLFILVGCEKGLDLSSKTQLSDGSFWKSEGDFEKAVNTLYFGLGGYGGFDNNSDIAGKGGNSESNGTFFPPESDGAWNGSYATIRAIQLILANAEGKDFANLYVAEARWFRAKTYFDLVKRFGDVPLITKVLDTDSEELYGDRTPRSQVVDRIMEDLDFAESVLPLKSELAQVGRLTKGAANALKARVALFEGTWAKYHGGDNANGYLQMAKNSANKVMESNEYSLFSYAPLPEESYRYLVIDQGNDNPGQIVASRFFFGVRQQNISFEIGNQSNPGITRKLVNMYLCEDGLPIDKSPLFQGYSTMNSEFENRDRRLSNTLIHPGFFNEKMVFQPTGEVYPDLAADPGLYNPGKFISENPEAGGWNGGSYFIHILRYAEVLLTYIEATYELDGAVTDTDLDKTINLLRDRAGIVHLSNSLVAVNGLNMLEEIRRERTIELALEGYRRDDLRRWKTAEIEMPKALLGVRFVGTQYETFFPEITPGVTINVTTDGDIIVEDESQRSFENKHYLYPIPTQQRALNPNLTQNPEW